MSDLLWRSPLASISLEVQQLFRCWTKYDHTPQGWLQTNFYKALVGTLLTSNLKHWKCSYWVLIPEPASQDTWPSKPCCCLSLIPSEYNWRLAFKHYKSHITFALSPFRIYYLWFEAIESLLCLVGVNIYIFRSCFPKHWYVIWFLSGQIFRMLHFDVWSLIFWCGFSHHLRVFL